MPTGCVVKWIYSPLDAMPQPILLSRNKCNNAHQNWLVRALISMKPQYWIALFMVGVPAFFLLVVAVGIYWRDEKKLVARRILSKRIGRRKRRRKPV